MATLEKLLAQGLGIEAEYHLCSKCWHHLLLIPHVLAWWYTPGSYHWGYWTQHLHEQLHQLVHSQSVRLPTISVNTSINPDRIIGTGSLIPFSYWTEHLNFCRWWHVFCLWQTLFNQCHNLTLRWELTQHWNNRHNSSHYNDYCNIQTCIVGCIK